MRKEKQMSVKFNSATDGQKSTLSFLKFKLAQDVKNINLTYKTTFKCAYCGHNFTGFTGMPVCNNCGHTSTTQKDLF